MARNRIAIVGTLDTKEGTACFLKSNVEREGCDSLIIDISGRPSHPLSISPDVPQSMIAEAAGVQIKKLEKVI